MAPLGNSTADVAVSDSGDQAVTGQVAFWAIMALALNAMAQSSTTTDIFFTTQGLFEGGLAPHMSSPIICLCDVLIELAFIAAIVRRRLRGLLGRHRDSDPAAVEDADRGTAGGQTQTRAPARARAGPNIRELVGVRLVLFLFAVLPQAIKVFSMQGVPALQAVVATYLAAPLVRTVTTLVGSDYQDLKRDYSNSLRRTRQAGPDEKLGPRLIRRAYNHQPVIIRMLVRMLHLGAYLAVWDQVFYLLALQKGPTFVQAIRAADWMATAIVMALVALSSLWVLGSFFLGTMLVRVRWPNISPGGFTVAATYLSTSMSIMSGKQSTSDFWIMSCLNNVLKSLPLLLLAFLGSVLLEMAVYQLSKVILNEPDSSHGHELPNIDNAGHGSDPNLGEERNPVPAEETVTGLATQDFVRLSTGANSPEAGNTQQSASPSENVQESGITTQSSVADEAPVTTDDQTSTIAPSANDTTVETAESSYDKTPIQRRWRLEDNPIDQMLVCGATSVLFFVSILYNSMGSANRPDGPKNLAFGGWITIATQFSAFRRLIPAALLHAWRTGPEGPHGCLRDRVRYFLRTSGVAIAMFLGQLILWFVCGMWNLFEVGTSIEFVGRRLEYLKRRRAWNCFAIYNLFTAATYFFVVFDGTGTVNPPWTSFLG